MTCSFDLGIIIKQVCFKQPNLKVKTIHT